MGNLVDGVQGGEQYGWEGEGGDRVTSGGQRGKVSHSCALCICFDSLQAQCLPRNTQDHQTTEAQDESHKHQHRENVLLL